MKNGIVKFLFAWLLLIPPSSHDTGRGIGKVRDTEKAVSEWINAGSYDTEDDCVSAREQNRIIMALQGNRDMAERFNLGKCVSK
jgi:hypothetical protein